MSEDIQDSPSQEQDNLIKDVHVSGNLVFAPVQIGTKIETQIVQISVAKVTQQPLIKTSPYQGLKRFNVRDRERFFGRDKYIEKLLQAVNQSNLSLVLGASGSGKSSVVRAGLIPELKKSLESQSFYDFVFTPNQDPFDSLYRCLLSEEKDYNFSKSNAEIALEAKADTLSKIIKALKRDDERWLIFIDQFEELFTDKEDKQNKRKNFIAGLVQVAKSGNSSIKIVLAMRSDFLEQFSFYPNLGAIANQNNIHLVTEMYPDELRQAIEQPAAKHGVVFEEGLVEQIIKDVEGQKGYLPLLQYTLDLLWESECQNLGTDSHPHIEKRTLTKKSYNALGGVRGALQKRIDEIYKDICEKNKKYGEAAIKQIFLKLVNIVESDSGNRAVSRRAYRNEFVGELLENTLTKFIDANLLVSNYEYSSEKELLIDTNTKSIKNAIIEIAHEILLSSWDRLKIWLGEEKEAIILKNWLAGETRRWLKVRDKDKSKANDELLKGAQLDQAVELREKNAFEKLGGLTQEENEFIDASIKWRKDEYDAKQRRKFAVYGVILMFLVSYFYYTHKEEQIALAGQLFAEADGYLFKKDYARAEILAAKSLTLSDDSKTRDLLLKAQTGGISLVSNSLQKIPSATLSQFSRNGQLIASVLNDEHGKPIAVAIVSSNDGKEKWRINLSPSESVPDSMTFNDSDGQPRLLAIARSNHSVGIWSFSDGKPALLLNELSITKDQCKHKKRVPSMAFHPSQPWIVTSSEDQMLCLWDYSKQPAKLVWGKFDAHDTAVHGIAFNVDGSLLASGGGDYKAKIWRTVDMSAGYDGQSSKKDHEVEPIKTMEGHTDSVFAVAFSPDKKLLASGGYDRVIRVWNLGLEDENKKPVTVGTLAGHEGTVMDITFSKDSKLLISSGKDKAARIWDVSGGRVLASLTPENGIIRSVAWQNFEDNIYLGGEMGWSIWSPRGRKVAARLWNGGATIGTIAFDPAGHFLTAAGNDGKVRVWDSEYHVYPLDSNLAQHDSINALAISADSHWLAAAGEGKVIHIWKHGNDWNSWNEIAPTASNTLKHDGAIWGLCFDPKGRWLFSSNTDNDKRIKRWKISDWSFMDQSEPMMEDTAYSLACDISGNRIISGDSKGIVKEWETKHLTIESKISNVEHGETNVWSVTIGVNPPYIFSGNSDGHVYRWLPPNRLEKIGTSNKDAAINPTINSVSFNQKRGWVAAGGDGSSIEIYDINLKHLQSLEGHDGTIWYVAFDPQGSRLAYGGTDRILRIFNFDEMQNLKSASPKKLYQEAQKMTGFSVEKEQDKNTIVSYQDE